MFFIQTTHINPHFCASGNGPISPAGGGGAVALHGAGGGEALAAGRIYFACVNLAFTCLALFFALSSSSQSASLYTAGYTQYQNNHFDSAIASFNQLITDSPARKEGYYNRGLCYYRLDSFTLAQSDFNTCLQIDSVFEDARFMKALMLQRQGRWKGACTEIKKLNTNYTGYNELKKRVHCYNLSVSISKYWYYMVAIMFMFIIFVAVVAKSFSVKRGL